MSHSVPPISRPSEGSSDAPYLAQSGGREEKRRVGGKLGRWVPTNQSETLAESQQSVVGAYLTHIKSGTNVRNTEQSLNPLIHAVRTASTDCYAHGELLLVWIAGFTRTVTYEIHTLPLVGVWFEYP